MMLKKLLDGQPIDLDTDRLVLFENTPVLIAVHYFLDTTRFI